MTGVFLVATRKKTIVCTTKQILWQARVFLEHVFGKLFFFLFPKHKYNRLWSPLLMWSLNLSGSISQMTFSAFLVLLDRRRPLLVWPLLQILHNSDNKPSNYVQSGPSMMSWVDPHPFNWVDSKVVDRLNEKGVDRLRTSLTVRTVHTINLGLICGW